MDYGLYTQEMGYRLYKKYENTTHMVFCAHGKDKEKEPYYCHPTPFFYKYSRATTLSFVDIIVVNRDNNLIVLVAEIEENAAEPKKVIGDVMNVILSEQVKIKDKDYKYGDMTFILGQKTKPKGGAKEKTIQICHKLATVNKILPDFERLTLFIQDGLVSKTTNPVENYCRQSDPESMKKEYSGRVEAYSPILHRK